MKHSMSPDAIEVWARFRLAHPELYSEAMRQSMEWPYLPGQKFADGVIPGLSRLEPPPVGHVIGSRL